jgi:hypothetical protein
MTPMLLSLSNMVKTFLTPVINLKLSTISGNLLPKQLVVTSSETFGSNVKMQTITVVVTLSSEQLVNS